MHESVPKAVVTLQEIRRLWKQRRMSKISAASLVFQKVKEQKQKSGADGRRSNRRHSEGFHGVRRDWFRWPRAGAATPADSLRSALREVDRSQGTIRKVQTCEQFTQDTRTASNLTPENLPLSMFRVVCGGFC